MTHLEILHRLATEDAPMLGLTAIEIDALKASIAALRVKGQLVEALEAAKEEMHCPHSNDGRQLVEMKPGEFAFGHRCVMCDENVDRNGEVRAKVAAALKAAKETL